MRHLAIIIAGFFIAWTGAGQALAAPPVAAPLHLVVLIDVSGSMRHNDPTQARQHALGLLLRLLPAGSELSLLTFAAHPHSLWSSSNWQSAQLAQVLPRLTAIDEHGAWTDIDAALRQGLQTLASEPGGRQHLILLTDGFVELGHGSAADAVSRAQIWNEDLAQARRQGVHLHTLALGGEADLPLLRHLALGSDGRFVSAQVRQLTPALLDIFDAAAPAQRLPVQGRAFQVDASIHAMTLLLLGGSQERLPRLLTPQGEAWTPQKHPASLSWTRTPDYELIEVKNPMAGIWHLDADLGPRSRLSVLSDLTLQVHGVPMNAAGEQPVDLDISLNDTHGTVVDPALLGRCVLTRHSGLRGQLLDQDLLYDGPQQGSVMIPDDGHFQSQLPGWRHGGDHIVRITLQCAGFSREFDQLVHVTAHREDLPPPASAAVQPVPRTPPHARPAQHLLRSILIAVLAGALLLLVLAMAYIAWHKARLNKARSLVVSEESDAPDESDAATKAARTAPDDH